MRQFKVYDPFGAEARAQLRARKSALVSAGRRVSTRASSGEREIEGHRGGRRGAAPDSPARGVVAGRSRPGRAARSLSLPGALYQIARRAFEKPAGYLSAGGWPASRRSPATLRATRRRKRIERLIARLVRMGARVRDPCAPDAPRIEDTSKRRTRTVCGRRFGCTRSWRWWRWERS
jgi:hypothetical protein